MTEIPWPTSEQLERIGFVKCREPGCTVYVDPANVPNHRCRAHPDRSRRRRPARTPYIGRDRRQPAPERRAA